MSKVVLLCPHYSEYMYTRAAVSIMGLMKDCFRLIMPMSQSQSLAQIRNDMVEHALKTDATHFMFVDGDELFPQDIIPKLLEHDKDIVGGWTVIRQEPIPNVYNIVKRTEKGGYMHKPMYGEGLKKRDRMGFGSVLVKREVFETVSKPWFNYDEHHDTEDLYFCDKARDFGVEIWVDYDIRCGHISLDVL